MKIGGERHAYEKTLLSYFDSCFALDSDNVKEVCNTVPLPTFTSEECIRVCNSVKPILLQEPSVLNLTPPLYIIGDLHGNILDLIRVFILSEFPPKSKYLFLGDYVDRGPYSVEVTMLLFIFKIIYPENVYLIRGNHEFRNINDIYGFKVQVSELYGPDEVYDAFNRAFDCLPLAAIIDDKLFCVHGGISPSLEDMRQLSEIRRPLPFCDIQVLKDVIWSDPSSSINWYKKSSRGDGFLFGEKAVDDFLDKFKFERIIRAHQCVKLGIDKFSRERVFTVFSSSDYDNEANRCGLMFVSNDCKTIEVFSLPAISTKPRDQALLAKGCDARKYMLGVPETRSDFTLPKCQILREIPRTLHRQSRRRGSPLSIPMKQVGATSSLLSLPIIPNFSLPMPTGSSKMVKSESMKL